MFAAVCSGRNPCDTCTIEKKETIPTCSAVIEHSTTSNGRTTTLLMTLLIEAGYWRATNDSTHILACYNSDACNGGLSGDHSFCSEGYTGPCEISNGVLLQFVDFIHQSPEQNVLFDILLEPPFPQKRLQLTLILHVTRGKSGAGVIQSS